MSDTQPYRTGLPHESPRGVTLPQATFLRRLFTAVGVIAALWIAWQFLTATAEVLLLLFTCVLIALTLRGLTNFLTHHTPLSDKVALGLVVLALTALVVGLVWFIGPRLASQVDELVQTVPESIDRLEEQLQRYSWGQALIQQVPNNVQLGEMVFRGDANVFTRITGVFSTTLSFLGNLFIVIFVSLYLAIEPSTYIENLLRLVPIDKRDRARDVIYASGDTLQKWLLTRFASMILVGVLTFIGLTLMNMPLALTLALIAAIGAFIPTFGPIFALVPAVLVGLLQSPQQALYVALLYIGVQMVDNYLASPIIVRFSLYLPPALIVAAQLIMGVLLGAFGLILAAPLAAAAVIIVRKLYVQDVLHDYGDDRQLRAAA